MGSLWKSQIGVQYGQSLVRAPGSGYIPNGFSLVHVYKNRETETERQTLKSKFHISCSFYMTINSNMKAEPLRPHLNLNVPKGWGTCDPPSRTITLGTKASKHKDNGDNRQLPVR